MLSLKNPIYIAPAEDPTTQDYCYYKVDLVDYGGANNNIDELKPIFYGKLYKKPTKKTINGVDHYFYTTLNDIIRPYFLNNVLNQSTNEYNYADKGSNILCFRVRFSLLSGLYPVINDTLYANVVDIHSFWGDSPIQLNDNKITSWCDVESIDNSLVYYKSTNKFNHYIDIEHAKYFNINFGYMIPLHYYFNAYAKEESSEEKIKNWKIVLECEYKNDYHNVNTYLQFDLTDWIGRFSGGAPRFCYNVGHIYNLVKYSAEDVVGGPLDDLSDSVISNMKILLFAQVYGKEGNIIFNEIDLPFNIGGSVPVNVKNGCTIYKATFLDDIGNLDSITFEGHYKESSSFTKNTYFNEKFEEITNTIDCTDELILNTGWLSESRTKDVQKIFSSKDIILSKTVFGNNTYTTSTYKVLSVKNSSTEYKYLSDKKLSNLEITLKFNKTRII